MNPRKRFYACLVISLAALAGCGGTATALDSDYIPAEEAHPPIWLTEPAPSDRHGSAPSIKANDGATHTRGLVVGLDQRQVEAALGPPKATVERAPATETIFREGQCTLSVTFYPDIQTRVYRALAYEVSSDGDTPEGQRFCSDVFDSRLHAK